MLDSNAGARAGLPFTDEMKIFFFKVSKEFCFCFLKRKHLISNLKERVMFMSATVDLRKPAY